MGFDKVVVNISWLQPDCGEDVLISSPLKPLRGDPGQDVSCELNKEAGFLEISHYAHFKL